MILPLYLKAVIVSKDFNLIVYLFFYFFSKLPPKAALSEPSILPFFNGGNPFLVHGFHENNGIPEKEQCFPYQSVKYNFGAIQTASFYN